MDSHSVEEGLNRQVAGRQVAGRQGVGEANINVMHVSKIPPGH